MVHSLSVAKQVFVVEASEKETLLTGHSEHVIVVLVIDNFNWSLPIRVGGTMWKAVGGDAILIVWENFWSTISLVKAIGVRDTTPHTGSELSEHLPDFVLSNRH